MASYLNPQPSNAILDDITNIRELENYNAQCDPSLGTDFPTGAKRLVNLGSTSAPQWQWQIFDGSSWNTIASTRTDKLMHNVDMLDGYHASTSAEANAIPVYNKDKLLVGGITGNAATATKLKTARKIQVGGIASGDEKSFDGTAAVTLTINSIDINNDNDNAVKGVLTTAHGGTGRTDGVALDVEVDSLSGKVKASEYGQIGSARKLTATTDLNTLVVDGWYMSAGRISGSSDSNFPENNIAIYNLHVSTSGDCVMQMLYVGGARTWGRISSDKGASWDPWRSGDTYPSAPTIYLSKSGSDNNTGFDRDHPVLTLGHAIRIIKGIPYGAFSSTVTLCVGEGNWGTLSIYSLPFKLEIKPYDGSNPTEYSASLPEFGTIRVENSIVGIRGCVANTIVSYYNGAVIVRYYNKIGNFAAMECGYACASSTAIIEARGDTSSEYLFRSTYHSYLLLNGSKILFNESVNYNNGVVRCDSDSSVFIDDTPTWTVADGVTVTGKKYNIAAPSRVNSIAKLNKVPGSAAGYASPGVEDQGVPNNAVLITGDQTIDGSKVFLQAISIKNDAPRLWLVDTSLPTTGVPTEARYQCIEIRDANLARRAVVESEINSTQGIFRTWMDSSDQSQSASTSLVVPNSGAPYFLIPATPAGSTGNQAVTAGFLATPSNVIAKDVAIGGDLTDLASARGYIVDNFLPLWPTLTSEQVWSPSDMNELTTPGVYRINITQDITLNCDFVPWTKESGGHADAIVIIRRVGTMSYVSSYYRYVQEVILLHGNIFADARGTKYIRTQSNGQNGVWQRWYGEGIGRGVTVGTIVAFAANSVPSGGYLICNGAAVSRTTYSRLFATIGTLYGEGDGSTTFNVPDLTDRFIQFNGTAGIVKAAGLPNATGYTAKMCSDGASWNGALVKGADGNTGTTTHGSNVWRSVKLDLSQSNAIFGASTTVQPPAVTMRPYIKY